MFFEAPKSHQLELYARLSDELRINDRSEWADGRLQGAQLDAFLEGPCIDKDGNLLVVDIPFGRILKFDQQQQWSVAYQYDGWPNGMRCSANGDLLVADHKLGLVSISPELDRHEIILSSVREQPLLGLNDLQIGATGDVYATDQGKSGLDLPNGRLVRRTSEGDVDILMGGIPSPNGLVFSQDGSQLFLAVTRANAIWRVPLVDGKVQKAGLFLQLSGGTGPDGLAICTKTETLLIVHPGLGVWQFEFDGRPRAFFEHPQADYLTNLVEVAPGSGRFLITESMRAEIYLLDTAVTVERG
jgi:gluconolactonase